MTVKELRDNVLRVLWLESAGTVPAYIWEDVTTAINSALQLMWQSPEDYFRNQDHDFTISAGSPSYDMPLSVQEVLGPLWIEAEDNRELHRITDQSEFNQFFQRFYGMTDAAAIAAGVPEASYYFLKKKKAGGSTDNVKVTVLVKPTPTADIKITAAVAYEAPNYSVTTITNLVGTETVAVPHAYVESCLLPLARWFAMRSHFFFEKDKVSLIEQDAARAMQLLQVSDPAMGTQSQMAEQLQKQANQLPAQ